MDGHGDDMKDSNLSQGACVCEDEDTTSYPRECARRSEDVVASVRIVKCHASMDVVIDVRVVQSVRSSWLSSSHPEGDRTHPHLRALQCSSFSSLQC